MRLNKLSLSAFRGISGELTLDISSPLTLVYAANGTGKTSICDAVEWLLTGEVARLGVSSQEEENEQLKCKFSISDNLFKVTGSLTTLEGAIDISRVSKDWFISQGINKESHRATASQVLRLLSPVDLVSDDAHHTQESKIRRDWIRGARLLTEHTMSILLDVDEDNRQARERVLSDFLGVRELSTRADKFRKYYEYLNNGYQTEKGLAAIKKELNSREEHYKKLNAKLAPLIPISSDNPVDCVLSELTAAAQILGVELAEAEQIIQLNNLRARQGGEKQRFKERRIWLNKIVEYWPELPAIELSVINAIGSRLKMLEDIRLMDDEIADLRQETAKLNIELAAEGRKLESLTQLRFNVFKVIEEAKRIIDQCDPIYITIEIGSLESLIEGKLTEELITESKTIIKGLLEGAESFLKDVKASATTQDSLREVELSLLPEDHLQQLRISLISAQEQLQEMKGRHSSSTGPLESLRLASRSFIESLKSGSNCPVCGHDWQSSENLRQAISLSMERSPDSILRFEQEILDAEKTIYQYQNELDTASADRQAFIALKDKALQIDTRKMNFRAQLHKLSSIWQNDFELTEGKLIDDLCFINRKIVSIGALFNVRSELTKESAILDGFDWKALKLHALTAELSLFIDNKITPVDELIYSKNQSREPLIARLSECELVKKEANECLEVAHNTLSEKQPLFEELKELWSKLTNDANRTDDELQKLVSTTRERDELLSKVNEHLESAQLALEADVSRKEIKQLEVEIQALKLRVGKISKTRDDALKAADLLDSKAKSYCFDQINKLFGVAYPMFSRVQANEVFDRISSGSQDDPFQWIAKSLNHDFSPSKHFSMGQRQDLALAIFLSRARGLGGTFFLDEPITHLDDLNRVALLDMFRVLVTESGSRSNYVVTTASKALVRHLEEKFACVDPVGGVPPLSIYELDGSPKIGVSVKSHRPVGA